VRLGLDGVAWQARLGLDGVAWQVRRGQVTSNLAKEAWMERKEEEQDEEESLIDFPFNDPSKVTLAEAAKWLRSQLNDGVRCPCCTQFAKVYKRKLNASMARDLIVINGLTHDFVHCASNLRRSAGREWAKLVHWGLLEEKSGESSVGSPHAGYFRITKLGIRFVYDKVKVSKYVFLYDGRKLGHQPTTDLISIRDALGDKFDYNELMKG
jgi:hypothetical protein